MSSSGIDHRSVGILGAGTMGAGIAQVAACAGWIVHLMDVDEPTVRAAIGRIVGQLDRLVEKGRMTAEARDATAARLHAATSPRDFEDAKLVIEAIVENLDVKAAALCRIIPALRDDAIIATNTSSLSVTKIGQASGLPHRTCGMHFFNPAPIMKLCEVIAGDDTLPTVVDRVAAIAESWGKVVARATDVPGFIVNHVARPYYLEALRIIEDGLAPPDATDAAMRDIGGFRMGPLELTDLIGQDVNAATTRSVWEQLGRPPLLAPSRLQESLVAAGHLGRKTKRGIYDYSSDKPAPAIDIETKPFAPGVELLNAANAFTAAAVEKPDDDLSNYIFARILAGLIVQALLARERGVASPADIDTALRHGVNYPRGPFEWARTIGTDRVTNLLEALDATVDDGRFKVPVSLAASV